MYMHNGHRKLLVVYSKQRLAIFKTLHAFDISEVQYFENTGYYDYT